MDGENQQITMQKEKLKVINQQSIPFKHEDSRSNKRKWKYDTERNGYLRNVLRRKP